MNPAQMATGLKKTHGLKYAADMARGLSRVSRELLTIETPGLGNEIELQEYEEKGQTRTRFVVNEVRKGIRLTKNMRYWMNVSAILSNEQKRVEAASQPKNKKN
jgi:hypothetical protein